MYKMFELPHTIKPGLIIIAMVLVCASCASIIDDLDEHHVHSWCDWFETEEGEETRICKHDAEHTETRPIQAAYKESIADIAVYLDAQVAGADANNPVPLSVRIDLGSMNQADSGWRQMLGAIAEADKYVRLNLSACSMDGTAFNPDYRVSAGKDKIVKIALPDAARSITGGVGYDAAFKHFTSLRSFSGEGLTSIGHSAFYCCTSLAMTELPAGLASIGSNTFSGCTGLEQITLPAELVSIGDNAFYGCTSLNLVICCAATPAALGFSAFYRKGEDYSNFAIKVPAGCVESYMAVNNWRVYALCISAI
jgi:hypothetical protein